MEKKPEKPHEDQWLKDIKLRSQAPEFASDEMVDCEKCTRKSPPNRLKCLYCGAELPDADPARLPPLMRKLEEHEKGFNVVFRSFGGELSQENASGIARLLKLSVNTVNTILGEGRSLPLARVESESEAIAVCERLDNLGVRSFLVRDESLSLNQPAKRIRRIELDGDLLNFVLFSPGEIVKLLPETISTIVIGRLSKRKTVTTASVRTKMREKLRDTPKKKPETSEISGDELLMDIFVCDNGTPFRVSTNGFDFSCLGSEKKLLANENLSALFDWIRKLAPAARADADYDKSRALIGDVWEIEQISEAGGIQRRPMQKFERERLTITSNEKQFDRYSRLQFQLNKLRDQIL